MKVAHPPAEPLVIFDGNCGFCRFWVERCKRVSRERMRFAASQEIGPRFPEIPPQAYDEAVQMVDVDGTVFSGADAAIRLARHAPGWRLVAKIVAAIPLLLALARWKYKLIARHRVFFSKLTRWVWGVDPSPSTFAVARRLFAHGLGVVFFCAFASLAVQVRGLYGTQGIVPAGELLKAAKSQLGGGAFVQVPSVFWLGAGDGALLTVCLLGMAVSLLLACGLMPGACALILWALYLSLCSVGSPFLDFQWDALLLETALIAAVFLPWRFFPAWRLTTRITTLGRWLLWWLLFRLMFESGVVKLASGDPSWRDLTAMTYHYETQPLPLWTAWLAHQAPIWLHKLEALATFAIEFLAAVAILMPRRLRHAGAWAIIALQVAIASTGNYAFFNLLTALLCVPLLDDLRWPAPWRKRLLGRAKAPLHLGEPGWANWILEPLAGLSIFLTGVLFVNTFRTGVHWPRPVQALHAVLAPFRSFNAYGLFAWMTKDRPEIVFEGSNDGHTWETYEFPWKPGDPFRRPKLAAPYQPRLDWQLWFAAMAPRERSPWTNLFITRLLEGAPPVTAMLEWNPFPKAPPKYVRALLYDYHFTRFGEGPAWWKRELKREFCPPVALKKGE